MIADEVVRALSRKKVLVGPPSWQQNGGFQEARMPPVSDGVGVQGLFVRVKVPDTVDGFLTMVQIEWARKQGKAIALERADWKAGHTNPNRGPADLRLKSMSSTHVHRFAHNYLPEDKRLLAGNLPVAEEAQPDPADLREFFQCCEDWLMIEGLALLERPPFQSTLPF